MRAVEPVISDLVRCEQMRDFFYGHLDGLGSRALPIGKTALMQGFAAGKTMRELSNRFPFAGFFVPKIPPSLRDFLDRDQTEPVMWNPHA